MRISLQLPNEGLNKLLDPNDRSTNLKLRGKTIEGIFKELDSNNTSAKFPPAQTGWAKRNCWLYLK